MSREESEPSPHEYVGGGLIECGACGRVFNTLVNADKCPACGHADASELPCGWSYSGP